MDEQSRIIIIIVYMVFCLIIIRTVYNTDKKYEEINEKLDQIKKELNKIHKDLEDD